MAKYSVTHKCGHTVTHSLFGKESAREWRIQGLEAEDCLECKHARATAIAKEAAQEAGLPPLTGTEKQIVWAETLRAKAKRDLDAFTELFLSQIQKGKPEALDVAEGIVADAVAVFRQRTTAKFWIENRGESGRSLLMLLVPDAKERMESFRPQPSEPPAPVAPPAVKPAIDPRVEATLRAERAVLCADHKASFAAFCALPDEVVEAREWPPEVTSEAHRREAISVRIDEIDELLQGEAGS